MNYSRYNNVTSPKAKLTHSHGGRRSHPLGSPNGCSEGKDAEENPQYVRLFYKKFYNNIFLFPHDLRRNIAEEMLFPSPGVARWESRTPQERQDGVRAEHLKHAKRNPPWLRQAQSRILRRGMLSV